MKKWICKDTGEAFAEIERKHAGYGTHELITLESIDGGRVESVSSINIHDRFERAPESHEVTQA